MEKRTPIALSAVAALSLASASGAMTYNEAVDGDLSTDETNPSVLALGPGTHSIIGTTVDSPLDRDFFTFTIAAGESLTSLVLASYTGDAAPSFMAIDDQVGFDTLLDSTNYLGTSFIFPGQIGNDILPDLAAAPLGGDGFSAPLGPGTYTIWYQETGAPTSYQFDLTVVPEPGSAALLMLGAAGLLRRRRA